MDEDGTSTTGEQTTEEGIESGEPTLVEADPDAGFNYPYYLYVPDSVDADESPAILAEPHNVAGPTDDARDRLAARGYAVREQFSLNGFSAAGSFVNRFTALHPERLLSVSAGGLNGLAIVPQAERSTARLNHPLDVEEMLGSETVTLDYHVGVGNLEELTGEPFDPATYREVNQFLYMGGDDDRDALLYPDAWTDPELRMPAILLYGADIHDQRWPTCRALYDEAGASAVFRVYEGVGHEPGPALEDIVTFHERSHAGDDSDDIRPELGGTPVE